MCGLLKEHIEYWKKNGIKDDQTGVLYDGDWWRGQFLLHECQQENSETAKQLQPQMLKGSGCYELRRHVAYWAPKGINGDPAKSGELWKQCASEDIDLARKLMFQLPGAGCHEFDRHVGHWGPQGKDGEPVRGHMYYDQCNVENPKLAQELAAKLPGYPGGVFEAQQESQKAVRQAADAKKACDDFKTHVEYWEERGNDGDPAKTGTLWSACAAANLDLARQLMLRMPGAGCHEFDRHVGYWGLKGYDGDSGSGHIYYNKCNVENPDLAKTLAAKLPGYPGGVFEAQQAAAAKAAADQKAAAEQQAAAQRAAAEQQAAAQQAAAQKAAGQKACDDFKTHVEYWEERGRDGDPARTGTLWSTCAAANIDLARQLMFRMPGAGCHEFDRHVGYWGLKGYDGDSVSGHVYYNKCKVENPDLAKALAAKLPGY
jgi:hypothetical protein